MWYQHFWVKQLSYVITWHMEPGKFWGHMTQRMLGSILSIQFYLGIMHCGGLPGVVRIQLKFSKCTLMLPLTPYVLISSTAQGSMQHIVFLGWLRVISYFLLLWYHLTCLGVWASDKVHIHTIVWAPPLGLPVTPANVCLVCSIQGAFLLDDARPMFNLNSQLTYTGMSNVFWGAGKLIWG